MNIEVIELNGISIYDAGAASITTSEPQCSYEDGSRFFYNGSVQVTQVASEHLAINAYMFRNSAEQAAANLQHTMTIGVMDECKVELIYSFKPKAGGGLDARIEVRAHAFGGLEEAVNAAMISIMNTEDNKLSIYIPKDKLLEGAGLGPDGCGSTFDSASLATHHLVDVSLSFVCAATGEVINGGTFEWQYNSLTVSLSSSQAPESCGTVLGSFDHAHQPGGGQRSCGVDSLADGCADTWRRSSWRCALNGWCWRHCEWCVSHGLRLVR